MPVSTFDFSRHLSELPRDRVACVDSAGEHSYGAILQKADELGTLIGRDRQLVALECTLSADCLAAYLAVRLGGHVALMLVPGDMGVCKSFAVSVELTAASGFVPHLTGQSPPEMHPDLCLLLSTSGTTGSRKFVRLSHENLDSNAAAIADYLNLSDADRGMVNLPLHYSYGLSIVNSHLHCGASIAMTSGSVIDQNFWTFCRNAHITGLPGVPHTYDLLTQIDLPKEAPDSLRYLTQAGGRLSPDKVIHFAKLAHAKGWQFYVMYGQTEAAPRMAYLPPDKVAEFPDAIGHAIPGGSIRICDPEGAEVGAGHTGELVYRGPNVMMGYATQSDDLRQGHDLSELRTGDLGHQADNGLIYITGRMARFVKIMGLRINLDEVERICEAAGFDARVTGDDACLLVATKNEHQKDAIYSLLQKGLDIPVSAILVFHVQTYPSFASGKPDYRTLRENAPDKEHTDGTVRAVFEECFGKGSVDATSSFTALGGDSLTYLQVALSLEAQIGTLPEGWTEMPLETLEDMAAADVRTRKLPHVHLFENADTLRALACIFVVMFHVFGGNADAGLRLADDAVARLPVHMLDLIRMPLLMALAGIYFAALPAIRQNYGGFVLRQIRKLVVPAIAVSAIYFGIRAMSGLGNDPFWKVIVEGYVHLWFLYALFWIMIITAAIDRIFAPELKVWAAIIGILLGLGAISPTPQTLAIGQAMDNAPYFLLGMLLYRAPSLLQDRRIIGVAAVVAAIGFTFHWVTFGTDIDTIAIRSITSIALVIIAVRYLPRFTAIEWIGVYSLTIYLWHPAANAAIRTVLEAGGLDGKITLFTVGCIVGVCVPIIMQQIVWYARPGLRRLQSSD